MSKIILLLTVFILNLIFTLLFLPSQALAVSCADSGIQYGPTSFPEQSGAMTINFKIRNPNILTYLKGGFIYLQVRDPSAKLTKIYIYKSPPALVDTETFSLIITDPELQKANTAPYQGVLFWQAPGQNATQEFCENVNFKVGAKELFCSFDATVPSQIPPNTPLVVRFKGSSNTSYDLRASSICTPVVSVICWSNVIAATTTNNNGFGEFPSVQIDGKHGDTVKLDIAGQGFTGLIRSCDKSIELNAGVLPQPSLGPTPAPGAGGGGATTSVPAYAGGKAVPGCTDDPDNPAIATAIGCIHTNPGDLIVDVLKFALGIGGGLAFLMMLLGAFQMLTSAGNPETLQAGKDRLTSAIIGLLVIIFSVLLLQIIGVDILGIPGFGR